MILFLLFLIQKQVQEYQIVTLPMRTEPPPPTPTFSLEAGWLSMIVILGVLLLGVVVTLIIVAVYFFTTKSSSDAHAEA